MFRPPLSPPYEVPPHLSTKISAPPIQTLHGNRELIFDVTPIYHDGSAYVCAGCHSGVGQAGSSSRRAS